jgi:hypothetical protein
LRLEEQRAECSGISGFGRGLLRLFSSLLLVATKLLARLELVLLVEQRQSGLQQTAVAELHRATQRATSLQSQDALVTLSQLLGVVRHGGTKN